MESSSVVVIFSPYMFIFIYLTFYMKKGVHFHAERPKCNRNCKLQKWAMKSLFFLFVVFYNNTACIFECKWYSYFVL
ncbi:unnamed protein product [Camellia sinensis]